MKIYDLLGWSFILLGVDRKGGGVLLSSTLKFIQVAYYSVTCLAVEPQKTKYSLERQPIITSNYHQNDNLLYPHPRMIFQLLPKNGT